MQQDMMVGDGCSFGVSERLPVVLHKTPVESPTNRWPDGMVIFESLGVALSTDDEE